jgi:peptidoglycan/LPS O-acetylase OafA/YrhL
VSLGYKIFFPSLTSLRFFAALAVFLYHIPYTLLPNSNITYFNLGLIGVNFFFVLSGFVIANSYLSNNYSTPPQKNDVENEEYRKNSTFLKKRFIRLLPSYYLFAFLWLIFNFENWGAPILDKLNSTVSYLTLTQSLFYGDLFNLGVNAVGWTVSVEIIFYIMFIILKFRFRYIFFLFIFLLFINIYMKETINVIPNFFYFNPVPRSIEFFAGVILFQIRLKYLSHRHFSRIKIGILQILSIISLSICIYLSKYIESMFFKNIFLLIPICIFILLHTFKGIISYLLEKKFLVFLGNTSYIFYLCHHLMLSLLQNYFINYSYFSSILISLVFILIVSSIIYASFEKPFRLFLMKYYKIR